MVLGSSLSTLIVALAVTPLVGSVLNIRLITLSSNHLFQTTASFDASRIANATSSFTYPAFAWNFLNASMPEMMTETFAVAPFQPTDFFPEDGENWTVPTTMYWGTLDCNLALLVNQSTGNSSASRELYVGDGRNWLADFPEPISSESVSKDLYGPWVYGVNLSSTLYPAREDSTTGRILHSDPVSTPLEFYFILLQYSTNYGSANYIPPSSTHPMFCKPAYWSAPVDVTTSWEGNRSTIRNWTMTTPQQPLQFNTTQLSNLWVNGIFEETPIILEDINPLNSLPVPTNFFNATPLYRGVESIIHARIWSGGAPLSNLASWAFVNAHSDYEALLDNKTPDLSNSLNSSLNNLFAFAVQSVLQTPNSNNGSQTATGRRQFTNQAMTIDPVLSRLLEGALGALIVCGCVILYFSHNDRQPGNIPSDPDSLGSTMSLMADSGSLSAGLASSNVHGYNSLDGFLNDGVFFSLNSNEDGSIRLESYMHKDEGPSATEAKANSPEQAPVVLESSIDMFADSFAQQERAFKRPLELRLFTGVFIALVLAALLIYGSVLYWMSSSSQGTLSSPCLSLFLSILICL